MSVFEKGRRRAIWGLGAVIGGAGLFADLVIRPTQAADPAKRVDASLFAQDKVRLDKLEAAVREMMDRSKKNPGDPAGWLVNANAHRDFCATPGFFSPSQIHFCWWFLPWHRAYLAVTERKLRVIAKDPTLAFPYWNWTTNRRIPSAFAQSGSPLSAAVRGTPNRGLEDDEVDFAPDDPVLAKLGVSALASTRFVAANSGEVQTSFGGIARPNSGNSYGNSRLEGTPHGNVHVYVGGDNPQVAGDMSNFATAARDPIFFAHHGNLDRLWEIWRQTASNKASEPFKDAAFLKHRFPFTWLDGSTITVSVEETMDTNSLDYVYDSLDVFGKKEGPALVAQALPQALPAIATAKVKVPSPEGPGQPTRYMLEIVGIRPPNRPMSVSVKVGVEGGAPARSVGSFAAVLSGDGVVFFDRLLRFDVTSAVRALKSANLVVTLVPNDLGSTKETPLAPLPYESMRIVTAK